MKRGSILSKLLIYLQSLLLLARLLLLGVQFCQMPFQSPTLGQQFLFFPSVDKVIDIKMTRLGNPELFFV
jgi:hypothetical protein